MENLQIKKHALVEIRLSLTMQPVAITGSNKQSLGLKTISIQFKAPPLEDVEDILLWST